jgi:hypothetical protein
MMLMIFSNKVVVKAIREVPVLPVLVEQFCLYKREH